jgi:maleylacetate reductase
MSGPSSERLHRWPAQQRVRHGGTVALMLPPEIADCDRVVLVTTRSLADSAIARATRQAIGAKLVAETAAMRAHSPFEDVLALAALLREHQAQRVVALGGGSVIDGCKIACRAVWDGIVDHAGLLAATARRDADPDRWDDHAPSPRIIAIPTTLSAAEFAPHAGGTDTAAKRKMRFVQAMQVPIAVLLDPEATLETPAELLLSSGIRAVDHAVERWCSTAAAAFSDAVSLHAMRMLAESLPAIRRDAADLGARATAQEAMWLSVMGGWAGVPTGASHGIGYILGGARGVPHGITSCVSLPAVLQWNAPVNAARQAEVARIFGATEGHVAVREFVRGLGLPVWLRDVGIPEGDIPALAAHWDGGAPISQNPRPVPDRAALEEILRLAA